jgi:hypothetical protein
MSQRSGNNWFGYIEGQTPVQGRGRVDGYPWYFRARGESWSMEIAEDQTIDCAYLPSVGYCSGWFVGERWGIWPEAGYMDEDIAWSLVEEVFTKFRNGELTLESAAVPKN